MSEVEEVKKAILAAEGHEEWDELSPHWEEIYNKMARAAITALDAFRAEEKRKNCKHFNRMGSGSVGSDGSGWSTWYCRDCGASYDSRAA